MPASEVNTCPLAYYLSNRCPFSAACALYCAAPYLLFVYMVQGKGMGLSNGGVLVSKGKKGPRVVVVVLGVRGGVRGGGRCAREGEVGSTEVEQGEWAVFFLFFFGRGRGGGGG